MLHRYWFEFSNSEAPSILNTGCGITAFNEEDAKKILHDNVFSIFSIREIKRIITDIDISTLDENHVRPNMGSPVSRGVWFPLL